MLKCYYRDSKVKAIKYRKQGYIPAIIYGEGIDKPITILVDERVLVELLWKETVGGHVTLEVEGDIYETKIQDVNLALHTKRLEHVDFMMDIGVTKVEEVE